MSKCTPFFLILDPLLQALHLARYDVQDGKELKLTCKQSQQSPPCRRVASTRACSRTQKTSSRDEGKSTGEDDGEEVGGGGCAEESEKGRAVGEGLPRCDGGRAAFGCAALCGG